MKAFLKFITYLTHPVFIPFWAGLIFFQITPKYHPDSLVRAILISLAILSIVIPFFLFFLLKNMGLADSLFLKSIPERKIPVLANIILLVLIMIRVIPRNFLPELFYFLAGAVATLFLCYVLLLFKIKASMHMMGIVGLTIFVFGLSYAYEVNLLGLLGVLILLCGGVATARLLDKAHNKYELILGSLTGAIPQFLLFHFWL